MEGGVGHSDAGARIRRGLIALIALTVLVGLAPASAHAQGAAQAAPTVRIARIDSSEAPTIDGDLSDPVWAKATVIDDLVQSEPNHGTQPTERTVVRIAYDSDNLYISVYCYDDDPSAIIATQKLRDGQLTSDDRIKFLIDPDRTRRDAYSFEIGPLGGYTDALVQNNADFLKYWNIIWSARGRIVADGWTAEAAIPFRNLSFDRGSSEWGFDVFRVVRRKDETDRWARVPIGTAENDMTYEGTITGLSGMNQGAGLDVQLYGLLGLSHTAEGQDSTDLTFRPSGNIYYKLTPSLTGTLTFNTDFSDAPLDKRQVNTTRFSLFTPETRQFFLQDAASFEFGGRAFTSPLIGGGQNADNGRPFFSRNIGLVNGVPVSLTAGAKLSGDFAGVDIGALTARTNDLKGSGHELLSVMRLSAPVLAESKVGAILTHGDPTGASNDTVVGADFQYADSHFAGTSENLLADAYYLRSYSSARPDDAEWGLDASWPNEPLGAEFHYKRVGTDFTPTLGFVNRPGIAQYRLNLTYRDRLRNSFLRWVEVTTLNDVVFGLDGRLQSREESFGPSIYTVNGDTFRLNLHSAEEHIYTTFLLPRGVPILPGAYSWTYFHLHIDTSRARPLAGNLDVDCCNYYNGTNVAPRIQIDYRPNETWGINLMHEMQFIRLPTGHVDVHITTLEVTTNFTPDMTLRTQVEYDNITNRFQFLARYHWEYQPGDEFFVALGETGMMDVNLRDWRYRSQKSQFLIRLGHTFQF